MSSVEEKEKPVILVRDYSKYSKSLLNQLKGVQKYIKEADAIASAIESLGHNIIRTNIWPRNFFYSEPGKIIVKEDPFSLFPLADNVFGNSGLFLSSETTLLVSTYAFDPHDYRLEQRAEVLGLEKQIIRFNVAPMPFGRINYPGLDTDNRSLRDIDFVANWIFDEGVLFTYDFLLETNEKSLAQLRNVGVDKLVLLPEDEFKYFAVNFGVFEIDNKYHLVVNSRCSKTIDLLRAEGFNVTSTKKPLDSLDYVKYSQSKSGPGGGVRCCTNELYRSSLEGLKDQALVVLGVYNKL